MKATHILAGYVCVVLTLHGCIQTPAITPAVSDSPKGSMPLMTHSPTSSSVSRPARTPTAPQPVSSPFLVPTAVSIAETTIPSCIYDPSSTPSGFDGRLLYGNEGALYLIGGTPLSSYELPAPDLQKYDVVGFSPDGKWLAFIESKQFKYNEELKPLSIIVISNTGDMRQREVNLAWFSPRPGFFISGFDHSMYWHWINDDLLYAPLSMQTVPIGSQAIYPLPRVFDPFLGIWQEDLVIDIPSFQATHLAGFSGDMERVLYVHPPRNGKGYLLLWDIVAETTLWKDEELPLTEGAIMAWAPDSLVVAYTNYRGALDDDQRVFLLPRDGGQRQPITSPTYPMAGWEYGGFAWSHDSRYLAMNGHPMDDDTNSQTTLFIYDRGTNKFALQCPHDGVYWNNPHWLSDDRYVALNGTSLNVGDLQTGQVFRLLDKAVAYGWSDKFPMLFWPYGSLPYSDK